MGHFSNQYRPRRREYSKQFKAEVLALCAQPGASVGGLALAQGLHSNIVHRWLREQTAQCMPAVCNEFIALALPPPVQQRPAPASEPASAPRDIRVEVRRSAGMVTVNWPLEDAASCAAWLHDWLR